MLLLLALYYCCFSQAFFPLVEPSNSSFSFTFFDSTSCGGSSQQSNLTCHGSVGTGNGSLIITPRQQQQDNLVGRVLFSQPVVAWPASFNTTFNFRILKDVNSPISADGMAFIMAQDAGPSPPLSYGSYMGILDPSTQGGVYRQLAVELDTYKNEGPSEPDANHIAIDTISITQPIAVRSLNSTGVDLKSGRIITVKIEYNGWTKMLQIYVAYAGNPLINFLSQKIIMRNIVPQQVYVGFSAATGLRWEVHEILSWNFTLTELPESSLSVGEEKSKSKFTTPLKVTIPIIAVVLLVAGLFAFLIVRRRRNKRIRKEIEMLTRNAANAPRMFTYRQLSKATRNFSKENLLGIGGFGIVYKGVLADSRTFIAVKKISTMTTQAERQYLAEISTIGRLRHKNLLQLQGWCHDHDRLLLVYEYMPNGSLDRYIGKEFINWETRSKVLTGLASVLVYLHEECGSPVVHRDVKPNNVMLDAEYNARLGDFGLARLLQKDSTATSIIAGTPGYLAPEVSYTGRATPESDVYSFGMVVLEVVCGQRSRGVLQESSLVELVWSSYEQGALLECVDPMLKGDFDQEQVTRTLIVGLACLHPDHLVRPKMRKVVQIFLNSEEPLMKLPESRPSKVYVSLYSPPFSTINTSAFIRDEESIESPPDDVPVLYSSSSTTG